MVSDAPRGPDGLPLQGLAPSSEAVLGDLDFQGLGVKATVWRDGSIFKLNLGTSASHWPTWTEHKETAPCPLYPGKGHTAAAKLILKRKFTFHDSTYLEIAKTVIMLIHDSFQLQSPFLSSLSLFIGQQDKHQQPTLDACSTGSPTLGGL